MKTYIPVLSIAGSDSSGGAGIQADIKTISAIGCYAMTAITAITAQNTAGVAAISSVGADMVTAQLTAVFSDIPPLAVKTGMLYDAPTIEAVAAFLTKAEASNIVVDPVMIASSGARLIADDAIEAMRTRLFPLASLVTPNRNEAATIAGSENIDDQIAAFKALGCRNILFKGGDSDDKDYKTDVLVIENDPVNAYLRADAVDTDNNHGTGCTLSSAIATYLAMGYDMLSAVSRGKLFITKALEAGATVRTGHGNGPVNHLFSPRKMKFDFRHDNNHQQKKF